MRTEGHAIDTPLLTMESIAREAGAVLIGYFRSSSLQTEEKSYLDVVTQADREVEARVASRLHEAFPEDAIVGEEGTNSSSENGRVWYIDPLDGTFNFSQGLPFWCVSIGLADDHGSLAGVIFDPLHDELFSALRGRGVWLNGEPIRVSGLIDPMAATLQLTLNYDRVRIEESIRDFNAVARSVMRLRNLGALALELSYVACGRLDAVCQRGSHPWDYAAGALICDEAGAVVSDTAGNTFKLDCDDALVAATPQLHAALLELLKSN
jgi:myo-inositol-1(or 4)-monophosphatase